MDAARREEIERKKKKILALEPLKVASDRQAKQRPDLANMRNGKDLKSETITFIDSSRYPNSLNPEKDYFKKDRHPAFALIEQLIRAVSAKRFTIRDSRPLLSHQNELTKTTVSKWNPKFYHLDPQIGPVNYLDRIINTNQLLALTKEGIDEETLNSEEFPTDEDIIFDFTNKFSYQAGVFAIFGETDYNPDNLGVNTKTVGAPKPAAIDVNALINYTNLSERITGCCTANDFLRIVLAEDDKIVLAEDDRIVLAEDDKIVLRSGNSTYLASSLYRISCFFPPSGAERKDPSNEEHAKIFNYQYNKGIDFSTLKRIKEKIGQNPNLKSFFIEFMNGIVASLDLAQDNQFLEDLAAKYANISFPSPLDARKIIDALKANAKEGLDRYAFFLEYYEELLIEAGTLEPQNRKYQLSQEQRMAFLERDLQNNKEWAAKTQASYEEYLGLDKYFNSEDYQQKAAADQANHQILLENLKTYQSFVESFVALLAKLESESGPEATITETQERLAIARNKVLEISDQIKQSKELLKYQKEAEEIFENHDEDKKHFESEAKIFLKAREIINEEIALIKSQGQITDASRAGNEEYVDIMNSEEEDEAEAEPATAINFATSTTDIGEPPKKVRKLNSSENSSMEHSA